MLAILPAISQRAGAQIATIVGVVADAVSRDPIESANILVVDAGKTTATRSDGRYSIRVSAGTYTIRVTRIGYAPAEQAVEIEPGQTRALDFPLTRSAVSIDPLVSIGTRSTDRTATRSAVPVDVVTSETIETAGLGETWEAVKRSIPSINVTRVPLFDDQIRAFSLRGLSPNYVLVLVNGKRRHTTPIVQAGPVVGGTSPVDINGIPTSAIERIEVLRDGAAAQYGSDAIAGVVNIILKSGDRSEATVSYGSTYTSEGGRDFRDGRYRAVAVTEGKTLRNGGGVTVTAQLRDRDPTNRGYPDAREQYFTGDPRNALPPRISVQLGDAEASDAAVQAVGNFPLNAVELYATTNASRRNGRSTAGDFRMPKSDVTVRAIHPDGFLPEVVSRITDFAGVIGARGNFNEWRWDLSSSVGGNSFRYSVVNTNNVSLGSASPTNFYAGTLGLTQWTNNLDLSRKLIVGQSMSITVAAGGEFRRDTYRIRAGEPDSWRDGGVRILDGPRAGSLAPVGSQGMFGFRPSDEVNPARTDIAGYLDVEGYPTRSLLVGIAGRAEHYSDFGSTRDARVSARLEPTKRIAIRGAWGTGFRAPSLIQSYYSTTRTARIPGLATDDNPVIRTLPVASPEARLLGAQPLRAEESVDLSTGVVATVPHLPVVTVDFYAIDVTRRIILSNIFSDATIARFFADHGLRGIAGGVYFTNAVDTKTRGVDVVATHGVLVGQSATVRLTAAYNRTETYITHVIAVPPELAAYQSSLFNRSDSGRTTTGQPRSNVALNADWSANRFSVNVNNQRFGRVGFVSATDSALDQTLHAKWITDLSASYRLTGRLHLAATVGNLFDVYPDEWKDFNQGTTGVMSFGGTIRYPAGQSPFGVNGRMVYVHLSYR
jgi:iron complex outermembrane receptor protein